MNKRETNCRGELICWKSTRLGRFTGSYEPMILINLVDARTGHAFARFAANNSTQEHLSILRCYIQRWGRPRELRTGNASPFVGVGRAGKSLPSQVSRPTNQIQRALQELDIQWSLEDRRDPNPSLLRFLQGARQQLVPCLRALHASTLAEANRYLEQSYLPHWNAGNTVSTTADSHRASLSPEELNSILSVVTLREIDNQNIIRYRFRDYQVSSGQNPVDLKGQIVRIETHLDETVHFRLYDQTLNVHFVERTKNVRTAEKPTKDRRSKRHNQNWMKEFFNRDAPPLWRQMRSD